MSNKRKTVTDLERLYEMKAKKFVRAEEGAALYSMGRNTFVKLAKDAGAVYHVKKLVLYNTDIINNYLEAFRDDADSEEDDGYVRKKKRS